MKYLSGDQLSLIAEDDDFHRPIGDWYDPNHFRSFAVLPKREVDRCPTLPKRPPKNLGSVARRSTEIESTLPKRELENLGSDTRRPNHLLPKSIPMKIGLIQQKLNAKTGNYYWYWRYYDIKGKYRSIYAGANMYDAIDKVESLGIPPDASKKYLKDL